MYVYPGLIDAHTNIAIPRKKPEVRRTQAGRTTPREPEPAFTPEKKAVDLIKADNKSLKKIVESGVTTALTVNPTGVFPGTSALINLRGETPGEMIVKPLVAQHITYAIRRGAYPSTLMGVVAFQRQTFLDLKHYIELKNISKITTRGWKRPDYDGKLEALIPVFENNFPVIINAMKENDIIRAVKLAREFNLNYIISGAVEGYRTVELLKREGKPVLLSLDFPEPMQVTGYSFALKVKPPEVEKKPSKEEEKKKEKEDKEFWDLIYGNAATLYQAGIKFAFCSAPKSKPEKLLENVRKTVEHGLPKDEALKALTVNPAKIFGVEEELGTIEEGKIANIIVCDKEIFDKKCKMRYVFVDGKKIEIVKKPEKKKKEETAKVDVSGEWDVEIETPDGIMSATLIINQSGNEFSGTFSSEMGDIELQNGKISGNEIEFVVTAGGIEATFSGTVKGNEINGTVDAGPMGTVTWKATKKPGSK